MDTLSSSVIELVRRDDSVMYRPTISICGLFIALFAISTIGHSAQAIVYRSWFIFPTLILGGLIEILGWSTRLWASKDPTYDVPFIIQETAIIVAPTPILAANFVAVGRIIQRLGEGYSRLRPRYYTMIFLTCDTIALFVQGGGAAFASSSATHGKDIHPGTDVVLSGIIFQMAVIVFFSLFTIEFLWRYLHHRPIRTTSGGKVAHGNLDWPLKKLLLGIAIQITFLFIRTVYRTVDLADGWGGKVMSIEWLFNLFDGAMITLGMYTLNATNPGQLLREHDQDKNKSKESQVELGTRSP